VKKGQIHRPRPPKTVTARDDRTGKAEGEERTSKRVGESQEDKGGGGTIKVYPTNQNKSEFTQMS
jgi:hypothetical protein